MSRRVQAVRYENVIQELMKKIEGESTGVDPWDRKFERAIQQARSSGIEEMKAIKTWDDFLAWMNKLLTWVPTENIQGKDIYNHLCLFYFVFDQKAVIGLQTPIQPGPHPESLTWISAWLVRYANAMGQFLDTPESLTVASIQSFNDSPNYNMDDYIIPRTGWKTFNDIFARNFKPGYRPIAAISDPTVIVSPADSTFDGQWEIRSDAGVTIKNIHWKQTWEPGWVKPVLPG